MWISKQEYDESGPSIVHRKYVILCFAKYTTYADNLLGASKHNNRLGRSACKINGFDVDVVIQEPVGEGGWRVGRGMWRRSKTAGYLAGNACRGIRYLSFAVYRFFLFVLLRTCI